MTQKASVRQRFLMCILLAMTLVHDVSTFQIVTSQSQASAVNSWRRHGGGMTGTDGEQRQGPWQNRRRQQQHHNISGGVFGFGGITFTSVVCGMCQLLGMNCATPTDFSFSFLGFAQRGGGTDVHADGWGVCFYEGRGLRAFHDPKPCCDSPISHLIQNNPLHTLNMVAHIRYATAGEVCLENVHPFQREMWGIQWCFAHNGDVPMFKGPQGSHPWIGSVKGERIYNSVGDTDSEAIFCAILNALKARFDKLPSLPVLHDTISALCQEIVNHDSDETILNFLIGCGQHLQFVYSWPGSRPGSTVWNGLHYIIREPPFQQAHLADCDYTVNFADSNGDDNRVAVIATKPLTDDEEWIEMERGELILFDQGLPHISPVDCFPVEFMGHGLDSYVIPRQDKVLLEEDMRRYRYKPEFFAGADI